MIKGARPPQDRIQRWGQTLGLAISGVFELGPVRDTYLNEKLRLTEQEIVLLSPMRLPPWL
jgi:hypothetical protein